MLDTCRLRRSWPLWQRVQPRSRDISTRRSRLRRDQAVGQVDLMIRAMWGNALVFQGAVLHQNPTSRREARARSNMLSRWCSESFGARGGDNAPVLKILCSSHGLGWRREVESLLNGRVTIPRSAAQPAPRRAVHDHVACGHFGDRRPIVYPELLGFAVQPEHAPSTALGYARIAHLSAPRVTSTMKRPAPSGVMTSRPRA
jgi:hypothetical protein